MNKIMMALAIVLSLAGVAQAQTVVVVTAGSKLVWDLPAADLGEANALTVMAYLDTVRIVPVLPGKTCTGTTSPFTCTVPLPSMTDGPHILTITMWKPGNITTGLPAIEGPHSDPFAFVWSSVAVVPPAKPLNLRTTL